MNMHKQSIAAYAIWVGDVNLVQNLINLFIYL